MKHVIIGTAGHVDHGKTLLIKALTGTDTDRLIEEKKRGITIELGFAHLDWEDGTQAGIVDVPGHEKFIKNMLAGAGGIDLAMLIIAADEGFMPQTVEHLDILTLLGIQEGLVVITKSDLVDQDWLEMMIEEVRDRLEGTFLAEKPIIALSAHTGVGIDNLKEQLHQMVHSCQTKNMRIPFRLPVDRIFSVDGFGTVVTGTLIEGRISEGELATLYPSELETRIRNLQVHNQSVDTAFAGQRVAINLAGVKKSDLARGDVVAAPQSVRSSRMLDVRLTRLKHAPRTIKNGMQVHLYHGATISLAKVILLGCDTLPAGESCYAQLRLADPLATKNGDHFVIRFLSPLETIGGGIILDDSPQIHKRNQPQVLESLAIKEQGSTGERVLQSLSEFGLVLPTIQKIHSKLGGEETSLTIEITELMAQGKVIAPLPDRYLAAEMLDKLWVQCGEILSAYHQKNPLHGGMRVSELRQKLFGSLDQGCADALLKALSREGLLRFSSGYYARADFTIHYTKRQTNIRAEIVKIYEKSGIEPENTEEILRKFPDKEKSDCKQVFESMVTSGDLILLSPQLCYDKAVFCRICSIISDHFKENESITLAQLRDLLSTSRKYALAILEYLDKNKITRKDGDFRYLVGDLQSFCT